MPRGDGTGPEGQGPKTGRGLGGCSDNNGQPQQPNYKPGFYFGGQGQGQGQGRGQTKRGRFHRWFSRGK